MTEKEYAKMPEMSDSEKKKEDWMNSKWRPMMGWSYMLTCIADFVIFPVLWSLLQAMDKGTVTIQWQPITLQGAGLYHIAMGAVLGIAAFGRTQEKLGGANNGGINLPSNVGTTYTPPGPVVQQPGNFGSPAPSGFTGGFATTTSTPVTPAPSWGSTPIAASSGFGAAAPVVTGFGGKPGPFQAPDREI